MFQDGIILPIWRAILYHPEEKSVGCYKESCELYELHEFRVVFV